MHRIYLLNRKEFVENLLSYYNTQSTLRFVKKYHDVELWLEDTNLIPDLQKIIMTYINDEIEVKYEISYRYSIIFRINCQIWFVNYIFDFVYYATPSAVNGYGLYLSTHNNVLTTNINTEMNEDDLTLYDYGLNNFFNMLANELFTELHFLSFEKKSEHIYESQLNHNFTINVLNVRMLRNIVVMLKLINRGICKANELLPRQKIEF